MLIALEHMLRHIAGPVILIWDRFAPHRSRVVAAFLAEHPRVSVEWLPSYAPQLNPEEYCHGNVKERLRNATPNSVEELCQHVDRGFARLRRRPELLVSFFRHAGLLINKRSNA